MTNVLMQVESEKDLMQWNSWFNIKAEVPSNNSNYYQHDFLNGEETCINPLEIIPGFDKTKQVNEKVNIDDDYGGKDTTNSKRLTRQIRLDSGITTHHLLSDEDDDDDAETRRGSEMTLNSCYNQPAVSLVQYGVDEINHALAIQQQRQDRQTISYSPSMVLGSITDEEHRHTSQQQDSRVSFYSSFAGYLSNTGISTMGGSTPNSESTTVVATATSSSSDDIAEESRDSNDNSNSNNNDSNPDSSSII
jgi:hypothetical protein